MKQNRQSWLSLRAKFKDNNVIEVVVMDHETGECFEIRWPFRRAGQKTLQTKTEVVITTPAHQGDVAEADNDVSVEATETSPAVAEEEVDDD